MAAPAIGGISHVALTVTDPVRSVAWYEQVFGVSKAAEVSYDERGQTVHLFLMSGFALGLMAHRAAEASPFSELRAGLDHLSFAVADRDALEAWVAHLDELGVEHSGIVEEPPAGVLLVLRDPDGIQLELYAP